MKNWKRKIAAWLLAAAVMCTSAALPSVVSAEGNGTDSGTSTTNGPTTKAYEGPAIPEEPAETDPSVYTTKEEALAALEEAQQKYNEAYAAFDGWLDLYLDAYFDNEITDAEKEAVKASYEKAQAVSNSWKSWVSLLEGRYEELRSEGCICGDHLYACSGTTIDETCPVCATDPEACLGPAPIKSGSYWQIYKSGDEVLLRITGDHTEEYPMKGWWPWDSGSYIEALGTQMYRAITKVVVEDNVTKLGDYMFAYLENAKEIYIGSGVTEWGYSLFGSQVIDTVTVTSPTFDTAAMAGGGYNGVYHINTMILDNPEMVIEDNTNSSGLINVYYINVDNLILRKVKSVGTNSFLANETEAPIQKLVLENVGEIKGNAFAYNTGIETLEITGKIGSIGSSAFEGCTNITGSIIIPESCTYIGDYAFHNCDGITELVIPETTKIGYSNIFMKFPYLVERMEAILAGKFALGTISADETLTVPSGWTDSHVGKENSTDLDETQITKAARWADEDATEAEVELQFSYTKTPGMDFLFVVDYSGSMAQIGNQDENDDSRFSDMQSKLLDVSDELLNKEGYDNRVAFVSFSTLVNNSLDFTNDLTAAESFILGDDPYGSTNYSAALQQAASMIKNRTDTSREAVVIFISDGQPNKFANGTSSSTDYPKENYGGSAWNALVAEITDSADAIKGILQNGNPTKIFGILQSVPSKDEARCKQVMEIVCTDGLFFMAADTQEFSKAVNDTIGASFGRYVITDVVDEAFTLNESSLKASYGTVSYDEDTRTITWDLTGAVPYEDYTLTFTQDLNRVGGSHPYGTFDTNEGDALVLPVGGTAVNAVETPQLTRSDNPPYIPPVPDPEPEEPEDPEEIPEEDVPLTPPEETEDPSEPDDSQPEEVIEDDEVPQVEAPQTGSSTVGSIMILAGAAVAVTLLTKKRRK